MGDIGFSLAMARRHGELVWRIAGHLDERAALILSEISPVLTCWTPAAFLVVLDESTRIEPCAAAVLRPMLRETARRGAAIRVETESLVLRELLQPPAELYGVPYQRTGPPRRLARLRVSTTTGDHDV